MTNESNDGGKVEVKLSLRGKALLDAKLHKLNLRAARLGVSPVVVKQLTPWTQERTEDNSLTDFATFEVSVEIPRLAGWKFLATIEHLGEANLVKKSPAVSEEVDLSVYRTGAACCDHCNTTRNRADTYVIEHADGARKQVGSNCLCDVLGLGTTPAQAVAWAEWIQSVDLSSLTSGEDSDFEGGYGGGRVDYVPLASFLNIVAALIRVDGYRSRKYSESTDGRVASTSAEARFHMMPPSQMGSKGRKVLVEHYGNFPILPTDADVAEAAAAIAWAAALEPRSDFDHNLRAIAREEMVGVRNLGIAAYVVAGYRRHLEKEVERKAKMASMPVSKHVGEIGKRIKNAKVTYIATPFAGENDYGSFFIHKFQTEDGSDLVWKTGTSIDDQPGTVYTAAFTPKKHTEFNGRPQTEVSRMSL